MFLSNTYETLCIVENFICLFPMTVCTLIFMLFIDFWLNVNIFCFSDFSYTSDLTSIVFKQSSKNIKIWYFSHKNRGPSVDKNGASSGFSSLLCCWHSWHISKSLSIIRQNVAVAVELAVIGKLGKTLLTFLCT